MANLLQVPDPYADQLADLLAIGRQRIPVSTLDSATFIQSWSQTLAVGADSGGTSPSISSGDQLLFATPPTAEIDVFGSALRLRTNSTTRLAVISGAVTVYEPLIRWDSSVTAPSLIQAGTAGQPMGIQAQDGDGINGGILTAQGGDSNANGGNLILEGGDTSNAGGVGGTTYLRAGRGPAVANYGQTLLQHADYNVAIRVQSGGTTHTGSQAINIDNAGLAFFNGTTVTQPTIVGAKGGNVALTNLLTALANMGLIIDNTT